MQTRRTQSSARPESSETRDTRTVTGRFAELLAEEGFRPQVEDEGDDAFINFKVQGRRFVLSPEATDPQFLHLVLYFTLDEGTDLAAALAKANRENQRWKALKFVVHDEGSVSFHFESFGADAENARQMVLRAIDALNAAAEKFFADDEDQAPGTTN
jgi:hypothetical protein